MFEDGWVGDGEVKVVGGGYVWFLVWCGVVGCCRLYDWFIVVVV